MEKVGVANRNALIYTVMKRIKSKNNAEFMFPVKSL